MVASELGRADSIETRTRVPAECLNDLDVTADGRRGVVATNQLIAQALQLHVEHAGRCVNHRRVSMN